jgi:hypothetical protein
MPLTHLHTDGGLIMAEHTKEPWHVNHDRPDDAKSQLSISNGDARIIANVVTFARTHGLDGGKENARRIVACVNACAGIPTEDLEADEIKKLIGAMRFVLAFYEPGQTYLDTNAWKNAEAGARRVMAKLDVKS